MSSSIGRILKLTTFGESHGAALGGVLDGFPAGIEIDMEAIMRDMSRRRPGSTKLGTTRAEGDAVKILSGVYQGKSTGAPIGFIIENTSQISSHYSDIEHKFRPGHADYTFQTKYGIRDPRGGGRSSGRETACRVFGGAMSKLYLSKEGIKINAGVIEVGGIKAEDYEWQPPFKGPLYAPDNRNLGAMIEKIEDAKAHLDSVGGIIECRIENVPAGLGDPVFDKLDALLAFSMLSIGAVKGIEFGSGFESARKKGSENNDPMRMMDGKPAFLSNNAGGILGGISNGNEIVFRVALKPTPSIAKKQLTITDEMEDCDIEIHGRHDPSIVPRAVVVVEAMAALTIMDALLMRRAYE